MVNTDADIYEVIIYGESLTFLGEVHIVSEVSYRAEIQQNIETFHMKNRRLEGNTSTLDE